MAEKAKLDWSLVPGTKREQIAKARSMRKPIKIVKEGSKKWSVWALDIPLGFVATKAKAQDAAHLIGRYKLDLGDFVSGYTEGY